MDVREDQHSFACLPLERLEAEITTLAGHLAAAECRWLLMVAEFDRRKGYEQWGCWCASQWLGLRCGLEARAPGRRCAWLGPSTPCPRSPMRSRRAS
jgi:hypothetical protein